MREIGALKELLLGRVEQLKELHGERFHAIEQQFLERDTRVRETAAMATLGISKSESATVKQIDAQALALQVGIAALESKISDAKDRLGRLENTAIGMNAATQNVRLDTATGQGHNNNIISIIAAAIALAAVIVALVRR
jgi:hypothetical protein